MILSSASREDVLEYRQKLEEHRVQFPQYSITSYVLAQEIIDSILLGHSEVEETISKHEDRVIQALDKKDTINLTHLIELYHKNEKELKSLE